MPLILLCGYPCSGKTYRTRQLVADFERRIAASADARVRRLTLHHIDDDGLALSRDAYGTARAEKDARAAFASAVRRALAPDALVLADGMNYIKGFRYQLYCDAKAVSTPSCVVLVGATPDRCRALHDARAADDPARYPPDVFENLLFRHEEPNGMNRWDAPLFVIAPEDESPPCAAIWEAMVGGDNGAAKAVRPNAATVMRPAAEQDYLYELDRATSDVVAALVAWQRDHVGEGGGCVRVPETDRPVQLPAAAPPSLPQLQRLRRQFIALNRQHALSKSRVRGLFVDYLNDAFA